MAKVLITRLKKRADFLNARNGARSHERAFVLQLVERQDEAWELCHSFADQTTFTRSGSTCHHFRTVCRLWCCLDCANRSPWWTVRRTYIFSL